MSGGGPFPSSGTFAAPTSIVGIWSAAATSGSTAWVELVAATPAAITQLVVMFSACATNGGGGVNFKARLAIGAAGLEVPLTPTAYLFTSSATAPSVVAMFSMLFSIPAGSRLTVRFSDGTAFTGGGCDCFVGGYG